jgi:hypothetical protein
MATGMGGEKCLGKSCLVVASYFRKKNPSWNILFLNPSFHGKQSANNRLKLFGVNSLFNLRNALQVHKTNGTSYKITLKVFEDCI